MIEISFNKEIIPTQNLSSINSDVLELKIVPDPNQKQNYLNFTWKAKIFDS